jgi:serine/threonine-protein kinase
MEKRQWERVNRIVDTALDLDREKRATYINNECEDEALRKKVIELLDSIEQSETEQFLEGPQAYPHNLARDLSDSNQLRDSSTMIGKAVGRYEITELIGHGGMGSVFKAKRADGSYKRQVAIKILRRGMDTPSNIARFKRERNILANLDHPNIAQMLDGGLTNQGLPYLVMEYIDGVPLLSYCDRNQLSISKRLELFEDICKAVNHAHQNAIIHRDLKPSNIFVTGTADIKVLDFGIAKLVNPSQNEDIFKTRTGARMLTLGYAAPEQLESQAITTATDAYVLGILLYELLAGQHPFRLENKGLKEIEEIIRNISPERPSQRFKELASKQQDDISSNRFTKPSALQKMLTGDLDAIAMKALRKEQNQRYSSVKQLLEDLARRKSNLPVLARNDSTRYNVSKFFKRHSTGLTVAAGFLAILISFITFYTIQISEERHQAELEAQRAEAVTGFLTDLIQSNYPENAQGDTITVRQFLDRGYQKVQNLEQNPLVKAEIMKVIGHTYRTLGQTEKAQTMVADALNLLEHNQVLPVERANTYNTAGLISRDLGQTEQAAFYLQNAVSYFEKANQTETSAYAKALRDLANVEKQIGDFQKATEHITKAIAIDEALNGPKSTELAESYYVYASILRNQQKYPKALEFQNKSLSILEQNIEGPHPGKSANLNNLAILYERIDDNQKAITSYRKAYQINTDLYGKKHFRVTNNATNIAKLFTKIGQLDSALTYNNYALETGQEILSAGHPLMIRIIHNHARIFYQKANYTKSDSLHAKAIEVANKSKNNDAPNRGNVYVSWAKNALQQQRPNSALRYYNKSFQSRKKNFGLADSLTQSVLKELIELSQQTGHSGEADSLSQYLKKR